jgi:DNA-binding CsgD family transcriptional regulator
VTGIVGLSSSSLAALGLTPVEERVYRQLIASAGGSSRAVARRLRMPVPEAEATLDLLVDAGLVRVTSTDVPAYVPGRGVEPSGTSEFRYVAEPPSSRLTRLLRAQADKLVRAGTAVDQLAELYRQMQQEWAGTEQARTVNGVDEVNRTVFELLALTTTSIVQLDRQPFVRATRPRRLAPAMFDAMTRGVAVRTIYAEDAFRVGGYAAYMQEAAYLGEQARTLTHLPMRFLVSDDRTALLPLASDGPWVSSVLVVSGRELVDNLGQLFDELWEQARQPARPAGDPRAEPLVFTDEEVGLLRMLADDLTEDAIGRHMGASSRTIGRRLSALQRKMGVSTRFSLGAAAASHGLL